MIRVTEIESDVLRIIKKWQTRYTNSPTVTELAEELKCSIERIRYTVKQLEEKGFLETAHPPIGNRALIVVLFWE